MKKKLLIIANNSDGLYRFRHELIEELAKEYDITAATPFDYSISELKGICSQVLQTEFDRRSINPVKDIVLLLDYMKIIGRVAPDLVITYTIKPNIYGGIACRVKKTPYAVNITGLGYSFHKDGVLQRIVVQLYRIAIKKAIVLFFENSDDRETFVKKTKISMERTYVLHGAGVNTQVYNYKPYPNNSIVRFLFIGRVMKEKGIEELLEAGRRLNANGHKCIIDVIGRSEENYTDTLKKYESLGWVKYHGFQTDVRPFIADCDCSVLPSYHEGMANVNLECASSGRPIITSSIPGCKEAVVEGLSGLLCTPRDVDSLYKAMEKMLTYDRTQREKMGVAARKHMESTFDKRRVVEETIAQLHA